MNPIKGEVSLTLDDGREFVLVGDFASRVAAEAAYGRPYRQILQDASEEYLGAIQALLFGMLQRRHPKITLDEVGEMLDQHSDEILEAVEGSLEAAAAPPKEGKEGTNPPCRPAGKTSGASGAKSASTRKRSGSKPRAPSS